MSQENSEQAQDKKSVTFTRENCVSVMIPAELWNRIMILPFRKRHPLIFWAIIIPLLLVACLGLFSLFWEDEEELTSADSLALVQVRGAILDPAPVLAWIRKLEETPNIKGILLRIDSPGGGAAASQEIYAALERIGKKMPIIASMGSMAASGGLMVAMAASKIYANPSTVTGSIGVRMDIPQLQDLMAKIGVGQETLVTAPFKDAASYTHPLSPEAREYLDNVLMNMHDQFVEIVAKGRKMSLEQAKKLASGKIFTGQQAMGLGLVDEMGGQYEAHVFLAAQTGIALDKKLVIRKSKKPDLLSLALGKIAAALGISGDRLGQIIENSASPAFLYQF